MKNYTTIEEYIASFEPIIQARLFQILSTIRAVVPPETTEKIAYGIPTFVFHGNLVHFGGYPHHTSLYPGSIGVDEFRDKLKGYKTSRGTIQFPNDKPLPLDLITEITQFCVAHKVANLK